MCRVFSNTNSLNKVALVLRRTRSFRRLSMLRAKVEHFHVLAAGVVRLLVDCGAAGALLVAILVTLFSLEHHEQLLRRYGLPY